MKKKSIFFINYLTSLCLLSSVICTGCSSKHISKDQKHTNVITANIDAKLLGCAKGTLDIEYTDPSYVIITDRHSFEQKGDLVWNSHFQLEDGTKCTLAEFGEDSFHCNNIQWNFIKSVMTIPSTVKVIRKRAFYNNGADPSSVFPHRTELLSVKFCEGIETIEDYAFYNCYQLFIENHTLTLPNSLQKFEFDSFWNGNIYVVDLRYVDHVIPFTNDKASFYDYIFEHCKNPKAYIYSEEIRAKMLNTTSWKKIAEMAYFETHIASIPASLLGVQGDGQLNIKWYWSDYANTKIIGRSSDFRVWNTDFNFNNGTFEYNGNNFTIREISSFAFTASDNCFYHCSLTIPSTVKKISNYAFSGTKFKEINLNEGVEEIGDFAFAFMNIYDDIKIVLPNSLQSLGNSAFLFTHIGRVNFSKLDHVISIPNDARTIFDIDYLKFCYFKNNSVLNLYSNNSNWSTLKNIFRVE